ncbi:MAG: stalk domain-containing protein [Syntrophomonadaceae bacterium]
MKRGIFSRRKWRWAVLLAMAGIMLYVLPALAMYFPDAPTDLTVSGIGTSSASLSWIDNSDDEDGFYIYRLVGDGSYTHIAETGTNATTYVDHGLPVGVEIKYQVYAFNFFGKSFPSNEVSYIVPGDSTTPSDHSPSAPSSLTVTGSGTSAALSWTDTSDNEDGFYIDRLVGDGSYIRLTSTAANTTSYTDSGLTPGMAVKYRVKAYNTFGQSAWSNVATYTVPEDHSATTPTTLLFYINADYYYVNGVRTTMDAVPVIVEGRTLLPIAYLTTPLGAVTAWNPDERAVSVSLGSTRIKMRIDDPFALVNGTRVPIEPGNLAVKPIILPPGRTMLPLSFIARTLDCSVDWNPATQEVKITYN